MPLRAAPADVAAAFAAAALPDPRADPAAHVVALRSFIDAWFDPPESDLVAPFAAAPLPPPPPSWLPRVASPSARAWAAQLHATWGTLCRAAAPCVAAHPDRHTLLPVPGPFVVPGARFREGYYWDSLWAVRGLLVSGLHALAADVVLNLAHCVATPGVGFVPNGLRAYYLNRSQPPLLAAMAAAVWQSTGDAQFLNAVLPAVEAELTWWRAAPRTLAVGDGDGGRALLSRYYAAWEEPRPESLREDLATADAAAARDPNLNRGQLFRDIASAAESGWDFSSRWFGDGQSLASIRTTCIFPADLNALLHRAERGAAALAAAAGCPNAAARWAAAADERLAAVTLLHWDADSGRWRDLEVPGNLEDRPVFVASHAVYASDFVPLWCGCAEAGGPAAAAAVAALRASGLLGPGGVAASSVASGEQWDAPNAWPPLQSMLAEGAEACGGVEGAQLAEDIVHAYLRTAHAGWAATGRMFEKFDAQQVGAPGGGGEYACMDGFGWTNGLALAWLERYGDAGWAEGEG